MDHRQVGWIVIGVIFCMSFTADIVQGKCRGMWSERHSCRGGNKRSEGDDLNMSKSRSAIKSAFLKHLLSKSTAPASLVKEFIRQRREHNPESYETVGLSETDSHITDADLLRILDRLSLSE
ncbi:uncharacterized protein LOC135461539 [Liolophura sinensis]|uniref:uncharacterized protein LOC135461539 n=1 Tax=Liolophura sinensis TaxID=3198878 RepID=UPI0031588DA3